jgi:hypothetical protein
VVVLRPAPRPDITLKMPSDLGSEGIFRFV